MAKTIKKHWDITVVVGIGLILAIAGVIVMSGMINPVFADISTSVAVTATIAEWLTFTVSTNTLTIGELVSSAGVVATGTSNTVTLTAGSNATSGFSITIKSDSNAGLCHSLGCGTHKIASEAGTSTVAAGEDHYGAQSTSSEMTVTTNYNQWDTPNVVGGIATTSATLVSYNDQGEDKTADLRLKATAAKLDPAGAYSDALTLTCLPYIP